MKENSSDGSLSRADSNDITGKSKQKKLKTPKNQETKAEESKEKDNLVSTVKKSEIINLIDKIVYFC